MQNNSSVILSENEKKDISIFSNPEFGSVRTVELNGKIYFCGNDVAKSLRYSNPSKALNDHCRCITKRYIPHPQSKGKTIEMSFIPEGDVYRLIVSSKLPSAQKFESWVFDEVLPSLRKNGNYSIIRNPLDEKEIQVRAEEVKAKKAELLKSLMDEVPVQTYKQILASYVAKEITGEFILPLPKQEKKTYTATEIADELHVTKNLIGKLANKYNLKIENKNGVTIWDRYQNGKQGTNFVYFEHMIKVFEGLLNQGFSKEDIEA